MQRMRHTVMHDLGRFETQHTGKQTFLPNTFLFFRWGQESPAYTHTHTHTRCCLNS